MEVKKHPRYDLEKKRGLIFTNWIAFKSYNCINGF